ncbi:MAG: hypothetical protein CVV27_04460 [Candidatus Melainabacteria bacterium HGW-Melainabacteria-1]|nr:MAG: hypothetical protein CVV27_04460 [Candidatus Melainabacteria bacterium HGW-Melainabacteria-1]
MQKEKWPLQKDMQKESGLADTPNRHGKQIHPSDSFLRLLKMQKESAPLQNKRALGEFEWIKSGLCTAIKSDFSHAMVVLAHLNQGQALLDPCQKAQTVFVSYGLSDLKAALQKKTCIYDRNHLNVAMTRARSIVHRMPAKAPARRAPLRARSRLGSPRPGLYAEAGGLGRTRRRDMLCCIGIREMAVLSQPNFNSS